MSVILIMAINSQSDFIDWTSEASTQFSIGGGDMHL